MPRAVTAHLSLLYQISNSGYHNRTKILKSTMPHIITAPANIPPVKLQESTMPRAVTAQAYIISIFHYCTKSQIPSIIIVPKS